MTLLTLTFYSLLLLFTASAASQSELRALLEFKKGITADPLDKILPTWNFSSVSGLSTCPVSWPGITCDPTTHSIISITLNRLSLSGDLKFSTLVNLKFLQNLSLSGNHFTGRIVPTLGSISSLQYLDLSDNNFSGPIPGRIAELWNLKYVNLSRNGFEGGFPVGLPVPFRNLQQLKVLDLHSNKFGGDVRDVLSELINLEHLDLSDNVFYGKLDSLSVENVSGLANTVQFVNFSGNQLNGGFLREEVVGLFRNLQVLDLSYCGINGELPSLGSFLRLKVLRLKNNELFGTLPPELFNGSMPVEELDLSGNGFTGSIHEVSSATLNTLMLSSNGLSGSLPTFLERCIVVDLSGNMISGDLSVMQNWHAGLEVLDLSSNKLSGSLPNLISQFSRLSKLSLRNNSLDGNLPPQLGASSELSAIDLSLNQLSGTIPGGFFASMTLINLNLSRNHFTGPIPLQGSHVGELLVLPSYPKMESLDLSHNSLSSGLPSDIGNMANLKLLNLSNNGLSGELPVELSKLTYLEYLDLSGNKFKGKIPDKLSSSLIGLNLSSNDLSGVVPENLRKFDISSFHPGNSLLIFLNGGPSTNSVPDQLPVQRKHHSSKHRVTTVIIVAAVVTTLGILVFLAFHQAQKKNFLGRSEFSGQAPGEDSKVERSAQSSFFKFHSNVHRPPTSLSFSNDHLLTSNSRSLSAQTDFGNEIVEHDLPRVGAAGSSSSNLNVLESGPTTSGRKSSPDSPLTSSPRFIEGHEQSVKLDVYSPDRLAGELFFLDASLAFTAEELSRAPAEVLGRSSHGTLYKATLDGGHMLTVKWLRVGLVKHKKEFAKEVKRIGSVKHPNLVPLRAYYWGPREQERLLLADYIHGDSLALHLYESTPRRYSLLSFSRRLKVAVDVARCLLYIHDRGMLHGNLKPTNILLDGPEYNVRLTDYGLHRLMTPTGIAEQILNLGALGYCAPELSNASKPTPSFKADVYAFGVILMEMLTRRSAGDIISGQSGAVDLTDWVRLCDQEGRRMDCIDRDIAGGEEPMQAMDDMLGVSLRCILSVNERPNIRQVLEDLCSISV
ncbi:probable inactive receptor kinase At5g10020 [Mercurialis annua]|uniref:probable inactive receptor kinase At5g10020 n=1 Tax=Mercurialis annua TaxID=3986 RepID=UPI00215DDAA8|nr:probable inactive receptor kinase At5g10020 [Mercurialis annua]